MLKLTTSVDLKHELSKNREVIFKNNIMKNTKKGYKEILKVLNKYRNDIVFDVADLERKAKHHLFGIELVENINRRFGR